MPFLSSVFDEESMNRLGSDFKSAGLSWNPYNYTFSALLFSILLAAVSFAIFARSADLLFSAACSLLAFALLLLAFRQFPRTMKKRRALELERDLPVALRSLATQLSMKISFERALSNISHEGYACSPEFALMLRNIKDGAPVREALSASAERTDSLIYKRAISQLSAAYEQGSRSDALKRLADDLISQQLSREKEFSARLALSSILFMASACIVPALLLAYFLIGSAFLEMGASPADIWLLFGLIFPLINLAILAYVRITLPIGSSTAKLTTPFSHQELGLLAREAGLENAHELKSHLALYAVAFIFLAAVLAYFSYILAAFLALLLPLLYYFYLQYLLGKRTAEVERFLPDAMMHAAAMEKGTGTEKILDSLARAGYGPLSEEFGRARNLVRAGSSVPSALLSLSSRNSSLLLERAMHLMAAGYSLGSDASICLREAADDMLSTFSIMRERRASAAMQKYTLLAGSIFVPFILGTLLTSVLPLAGPNSNPVADAAAGASQIYILIYALLSSLMIAQLEGSFRRFFPYFIILAPLSFAVFAFSKAHTLFSLFS